MGTRSLTFVHDGANAKALINMYRQMDGYPTGHGRELYEFLKPIKLCNGIGLVTEEMKLANGAGCLAAQMIANFKDGVGHIYIEPVTATDCGQDYTYHVYADEADGITVKCFEVEANKRRKMLFEGTVEAFGVFCHASAD
jgi:hypothetical protein